MILLPAISAPHRRSLPHRLAERWQALSIADRGVRLAADSGHRSRQSRSRNLHFSSRPGLLGRMRALEGAGAIDRPARLPSSVRKPRPQPGRSASHSEFAGVPAETQRAWIREGMRILRGHGLNPSIWVAPRHGFDATHARALREEGILRFYPTVLRACRSFAAASPGFRSNSGARSKNPRGLWTICIHPNTAHEAEIAALRAFSPHTHRSSPPSIVSSSEIQPATLTLAERIQAECALWRLKSPTAGKRSAARRSSAPATPHKAVPSGPAQPPG
jgi:hypothetical protein